LNERILRLEEIRLRRPFVTASKWLMYTFSIKFRIKIAKKARKFFNTIREKNLKGIIFEEPLAYCHLTTPIK